MLNGGPPRVERLRTRFRRAAGLVRRRRDDPAIYRHGIPNRAEEIVAGDEAAQALIAAGRLTMGDYSYYAPTVRLYAGDTAKVRVGRFSSIASGVEVFVGGAHRSDWVSTYGIRIVFDLPGAFEDGTPMSRGDVVIGSDCWLANGAVVMSGVTIGDGAVVGARSVVTRDVRPYAVVAGNPAREVRRRFSDEQVEALLRIAWWEWPAEQVIERVSLLCSPDIDGFIRRFDPALQPDG